MLSRCEELLDETTDRGMRVPTFTSLVPAQLTRLLDAADDDRDVLAALRSFETILVGGQALASYPALALVSGELSFIDGLK